MVKAEGSADALPADTISERVLPVLNGSGVSVVTSTGQGILPA
ncbi:hypothetical protein ACLBOM_08295 [Escherichia coli]